MLAGCRTNTAAALLALRGRRRRGPGASRRRRCSTCSSATIPIVPDLSRPLAHRLVKLGRFAGRSVTSAGPRPTEGAIGLTETSRDPIADEVLLSASCHARFRTGRGGGRGDPGRRTRGRGDGAMDLLAKAAPWDSSDPATYRARRPRPLAARRLRLLMMDWRCRPSCSAGIERHEPTGSRERRSCHPRIGHSHSTSRRDRRAGRRPDRPRVKSPSDPVAGGVAGAAFLRR